MTHQILQHCEDSSRFRELQRRLTDRAERAAGEGASNLARVCAETSRVMGRKARELERVAKGHGRALSVMPAFVLSDFLAYVVAVIGHQFQARPLVAFAILLLLCAALAAGFILQVVAAAGVADARVEAMRASETESDSEPSR